ncbi:hypothetical protein PFISCL1PPCAC_27847, partial [Pristionchus fissidentatus]
CVSRLAASMEIRYHPFLFFLLLGVSSAIDGDLDTDVCFFKKITDEETALSQSDFDSARLQVSSDTPSGEIDDPQCTIRISSREISNNSSPISANEEMTSKTVHAFMGEEVEQSPGVMKNAIRNPYLLWPDGRIPYTISTQYNRLRRKLIASAINDFTANTCIRFVPKGMFDKNYIHITPIDGCYSMVGMQGGRQNLSIGKGCFEKGIVIHELMHAVGFFHEQSRADRDSYVTIHYENIIKNETDQFDKYSLKMITHLGTPYDYGSVMHYKTKGFSLNGERTISPKKPGVSIGQRIGFSSNDVVKINKLYSCVPGSKGNIAIVPINILFVQATVAPKQIGTAMCKDKRNDCAVNARKGNCNGGLAKFMRKNCPGSCGICNVS